MKQILTNIAQILWKIDNMDRGTVIGILAPLKTEEQARIMLEYLKTIDLKTTKQSPIIKKALEISEM